MLSPTVGFEKQRPVLFKPQPQNHNAIGQQCSKTNIGIHGLCGFKEDSDVFPFISPLFPLTPHLCHVRAFKTPVSCMTDSQSLEPEITPCCCLWEVAMTTWLQTGQTLPFILKATSGLVVKRNAMARSFSARGRILQCLPVDCPPRHGPSSAETFPVVSSAPGPSGVA